MRIRNHLPLEEKRETEKAVHVARDPRESAPFFRVVFFDPRNKSGCPSAASDLADKEIGTRRESDNEKGLDYYARHIPPVCVQKELVRPAIEPECSLWVNLPRPRMHFSTKHPFRFAA
jgi:hypothetical protein